MRTLPDSPAPSSSILISFLAISRSRFSWFSISSLPAPASAPTRQRAARILLTGLCLLVNVCALATTHSVRWWWWSSPSATTAAATSEVGGKEGRGRPRCRGWRGGCVRWRREGGRERKKPPELIADSTVAPAALGPPRPDSLQCSPGLVHLETKDRECGGGGLCARRRRLRPGRGDPDQMNQPLTGATDVRFILSAPSPPMHDSMLAHARPSPITGLPLLANLRLRVSQSWYSIFRAGTWPRCPWLPR